MIGIEVMTEGKAVLAVEPAEIGAATLFGFADGECHVSSPFQVGNALRLKGRYVRSNFPAIH